jgi:hypothetical protein
MSDTCMHLDQVANMSPSSDECEDWWYCYLDDLAFVMDGAPSFAHP